MATTTLSEIQKKVRRLTRSPSESQLTTAQLDQYINTFVLYDFPEHLRLFNLRTTLTFYTEAYKDTYTTNDTPQLTDFKNVYITIHPPIYIAGYPALFSQSREQFFTIYPFVNFIQQVGTGDGVTTAFSGTLSQIPILANNVTFTALDSNGATLNAKDTPFSNTNGFITDLNGNSIGTINYVTGVWSLTFGTAPADGNPVTIETVPYQPTLPNSILYYDGTFTVRPVPDKGYPIIMEVYKRPTELLASNQSPELNEWWQYIAYGAAKKVFEDRMDLESVAQIMPEYKMQERLILRRTIVQQTNQRTATIYTQQTNLGAGPGYGWNGGGSF